MMAERHLLLAGAGHAHVEVLWQFARHPLPGWRITLLTREGRAPYSGMLPGVVAGLYAPDQALIDIASLCARAGAALELDRVEGLDPAARLLRRTGGPPLAYDLLSLDTGAAPAVAHIPGAAQHALPLKPFTGLLARLTVLAEQARPEQVFAVVGAGAAGTEMAMALSARLGRRGVTIVLIAGVAGLLPGFPEEMRVRVATLLARRGVRLMQGDDVTEVTADGVLFRRSPPLATDAVIWAAGAAPPRWLERSGLRRDAVGFIQVEPTLQVVGQPAVFAAGDVSSLLPHPLPKAGVFAVRQGPILAHNLRAAAEGRQLRPYDPQSNWLVLLNTGDGKALGTRNGMVFGGRWVWWWKDLIDRRFVARYQTA